MKKSTFLTGLASTILLLIGVFMKTMHWPGAAVVLTVAIATFSIGYSVMLYLDKSSNAQKGTDKISNLMVLLTMIVVPVSFLFKAMHWPGAGIGIIAGHCSLIVLVLVLYIQGSGEPDEVKKLHINSSAIILTLITAISLYIWWRTSNPSTL